MNNINNAGLPGLLWYIWKGHLTNWLWRNRHQRRIVRERVHMQVLTKKLRKEIPYIKTIKARKFFTGENNPDEKVFTLWLQGGDNAPHIIQACFESVKRNCRQEFVILDEKSIDKYIHLPDFIKEKWEKKQICPAHYSDIIRMLLLWEYGGYWMDATNFMTSDFPEEVKGADFFMLLANGNFNPHMFVQNCFIRAKKGDPLLGMWLDAVLHYWKNNDHTDYYFLVQTLFKYLVTYNTEAKVLYEKMPKISMDPTHRLWHDIGNLPFDEKLYRRMCEDTFFQKCSFKPHRGANNVNEIIPGSMADKVINGI